MSDTLGNSRQQMLSVPRGITNDQRTFNSVISVIRLRGLLRFGSSTSAFLPWTYSQPDDRGQWLLAWIVRVGVVARQVQGDRGTYRVKHLDELLAGQVAERINIQRGVAEMSTRGLSRCGCSSNGSGC